MAVANRAPSMIPAPTVIACRHLGSAVPFPTHVRYAPGAMLRIDELHKAYGSLRALRGVSLDIAPGEILGLLGPNGAGKTTLVSIVAGLRRADAGRVTVDGIDALAHPHQARSKLGLAPQETGVYPVVKVRPDSEAERWRAGSTRWPSRFRSLICSTERRGHCRAARSGACTRQSPLSPARLSCYWMRRRRAPMSERGGTSSN